MGLNCKSVSGEDDLDGWDQNANFEQPKPVIKRQQQQQEQKIEKLKCPRCDSANTKFCYYNNYNKEQPRHFCKTCKRHWTKGGTLRNVPEGGGRKNKRPRISNSPTRSSNPINSVFNPANESINQKSEPHSFPFSYDDPKTLVPVDPYKDLIPSSLKSGSIFLGSSSSTTTKNIYPNFLSSSFSFDGNPYSVSSRSFQQSNSAYNYIGGNEATEDSMAMTSSNNIVDQSLNVPVPTGCAMEMQSWWNWDDIDALVSADNNAPWIKDSEINS